MGVVRKITRRPIPLGVASADDNGDNNNNNEVNLEEPEKKVEHFDTKLKEEEPYSNLEGSTPRVISPLNVNWEGLVTTISSIGKATHLTDL